jgi:hypothetical protein
MTLDELLDQVAGSLSGAQGPVQSGRGGTASAGHGTTPPRAAQPRLVVAMAALWQVSVGGEADDGSCQASEVGALWDIIGHGPCR